MKRLAMLLLTLALLTACGTAPEPAPTTRIQPKDKTYQTEQDGLKLSVTLPEFVLFGQGFTLTAVIENKRDTPVTAPLPTGTENMHYEIRIFIGGTGAGERGFIDDGFADADTIGRVMNEMMSYLTHQPGASFTQTVHFLPGRFVGESYPTRNIQSGEVIPLTPEDGAFEPFPPGEYQGRAKFTWSAGSSEDYDGYSHDGRNPVHTLLLEFPALIR